MQYTTQMDAARKGIITAQMETVAQKEGIPAVELAKLMAEGKVIIPCNKNHKSISPAGVGSMLKTKINVNLGTSRDCKNLEMELQKVESAVSMGAEAIMDLSSYGDTGKFRRMLTEKCPAMIGTVPIYDAVVYYHKPLIKITSEEWLDIVRMHAQDGVDFMTIHCGINKETAHKFKRNKRLTNIVSRGGSIIFAWMEMTGKENPFYEHFDEILEICREYDVTLSLGDACRPGSIADGTDAAQIEELIALGELTKRAWEKDVQVMIEGPGHMPLNQIAANMEIEKTLCHGAPFYVLGPIVTDIAPGYDHITSAIGGAVAAMNGASFLCYVTPAEHLRLPDVEDVKEGIIAARIAAHAADIAKGVPGAANWDNQMSLARKQLNWEEMFRLAIDPEKARRYRASSKPEKEDTCSMCGNFCAVKNMNRILDGEIVSIFDE
ncbi:thiamine biosynthesis protein ThiC [Marvinbryantia formatexigens DSM 14469]|uniref:Phosphomethylpyrimidine synthase n=1 Tax=Marvinbryantia formatexigens DSM 14469 TaxID=478749 RepID=C6LBN0_9FIRM|nr:phosphomethylpyrimidine synthase ThiC [Marvinbryantia formatexigens]EET61832.1 thiamine biosynthesis protein ThiC [Marvinbryantia formatexigens DSM 14469]UWO25805.1 phosphomethylpyrimidine synthase ThiC [Marvinbryantia formatexigens DSM 14469]SDF37871.1 hydroxymethylpyrimidine synthase [Marvinbryantia formatexigens]